MGEIRMSKWENRSSLSRNTSFTSNSGCAARLLCSPPSKAYVSWPLHDPKFLETGEPGPEAWGDDRV